LPSELSALWSINSAESENVSADATPGPSPSPFFGRIERSLDGGKTWEQLHVDDSVSFRAVHASGASVWAGGSRGTLYHSMDGGKQWRRVIVGSELITDTIVGIDFADSNRGLIKSDANETWATSDGGHHWQRRAY